MLAFLDSKMTSKRILTFAKNSFFLAAGRPRRSLGKTTDSQSYMRVVSISFLSSSNRPVTSLQQDIFCPYV